MPKLTDTQLVILSAAAKRKDGTVLPPPKSLKAKGGALTGTLKSLLKKALIEEQPAGGMAPSWRETENGSRLVLVITKSGLQAIGVAPGQAAKGQDIKDKAPRKVGRKRRAAKSVSEAHKPKTKASPPLARTGSKQALLIGLLSRSKGATIAEAQQATGWQPHSVRGAISGNLKKKLGLAVTSEMVGRRGRVYRIAQGR
jgi:hypothetical protein